MSSGSLQLRDGAITFGDLEGKLGALRVECSTCTRAGQYWIARLIEQRGRDGKIADLLAEVSATAHDERRAV
jgi:hypothetical protein